MVIGSVRINSLVKIGFGKVFLVVTLVYVSPLLINSYINISTVAILINGKILRWSFYFSIFVFFKKTRKKGNI